MAYHYNAFISYNHNPRDMKIARLLQQKLERYKLPKDASSEAVGIERVFLDKGELEVAGDLNKVIQDALENSDYLIVICSPEGKESIWVQREMEFFLRNHSIDRILTVITAGEPGKVLPDLLLWEDTVNEETGETERVFREPLSCDYRLPAAKANREELPRLVAALLGCRYDDLMQRQRTYRMKRQIALLAAAALILTVGISYLVWSRHQITTNYESSLREQSLNLAMQSEQALGKGDRLGAIELALGALPSEKNSRPVVSEAVLALANALYLYHTPDDEKWSSVKQYDYGTDHAMLIPFSTGGTDYLADLCSDGRVRIWDSGSKTEVMSEYTQALSESGTKIELIAVTDDKDLLLISNTSLISVDVAGEKEKYNIQLLDPDKLDGRPGFSHLTEDQFCTGGGIMCIPAYTTSYQLFIIDTAAGKLLRQIPVEELPWVLRISEDGSRVAALYTSNSYDEDDMVSVYDVSSGDTVQTFGRPCVYDFLFDGDDRILICGFTVHPDTYDSSLNNSFEYKSGDVSYSVSVSKEHTVTLSCCDLGTGAELWNIEKEGMYSGTPWLETGPAGSLYEGAVVCTTGCDAMICSMDGNILKELDFHSPVVMYNHKEDVFRAVLANGCLAYYKPEDDGLTIAGSIFLSPVYTACYDHDSDGSRLFTLTTDTGNTLYDNYILQYEYGGSDPEWERFPSTYEETGLAIVQGSDAFDGRFLKVYTKPGADTVKDFFAHITEIDTGDGSVILDKDIVVDNAEDYDGLTYSGTSEDNSTAWIVSMNDESHSALFSVDLESGEVSKTDISFPEESSEDGNITYTDYRVLEQPSVEHCGSSYLHDGRLYYPALKTTVSSSAKESVTTYTLVIISLDPSDGSAEEKTVCEFEEKPEFEKDRRVSFNPEAGKLVLVDETRQISCYGLDGKLDYMTDQLDFFPYAVTVTDDGTVLALDSGDESNCVLHVFAPGSTAETLRSDLGVIDTGLYGRMELSALPDESSLMLVIDEDDALILGSSDWSVKSRITGHYSAFDPDNNIFILHSSEDRMNSRVPYRTLEEMVKEGHEALGK